MPNKFLYFLIFTVLYLIFIGIWELISFLIRKHRKKKNDKKAGD